MHFPDLPWTEGEIEMIIDSHVHLLGEGWNHKSFFMGGMRVVGALLGKTTGQYLDPELMGDDLLRAAFDTTGEKLIAAMGWAGVDKSCIFAVDYGLATGEPEVSMLEKNRLIAEAAKRFSDRLISYFTIDPRRHEGLDMFQRAVEDWGMRGLKFHPTSGFYPYDLVAYPFYEKCREYGIPVLFHTGGITAPLKTRFAQPINVDDVAADFPDIPIIMAHIGFQKWEEALTIAEMKPNIYFDFSAWQPTYNNHPQDFYHMLRTVVGRVGPWRVFFGSDGPFANMACPLDRWVKALEEARLNSSPEICFTSDEIEIIMGKAYARLLNLD